MPNADENIFKGWHLKREVHVSHLVLTLAFVVSGAVAWSTVRLQAQRNERDIEALTARVENTPERLARIEVAIENLSSGQQRILNRLERENR